MRETEKALKRRRLDPEFWNRVMRGYCLDIGPGDNPVKAGDLAVDRVRTFDKVDGDANFITRYVREQFTTVHSSQCLEHTYNCFGCMLMWFSLVEVGGHMIITVPDCELYEQNHWPSIYNTDHKWRFTLDDKHPEAVRLDYLAKALPDAEVLRCELITTNYNFALKDVDQTLGDAEAFLELVVKKL